MISLSICQITECCAVVMLVRNLSEYWYELSGLYWHLSILILFILIHRIPGGQYYPTNADGEQRLNAWLKDTFKILALDMMTELPIYMEKYIFRNSHVHI